MKMFIVDYWRPFPSSEYGGVVVVIAESAQRAAFLLTDPESFDAEYNPLIPEAVAAAQSYDLAGDVEEGVVFEFYT